MMSGTLCLSALPCNVCGIATLLCSVLPKTPCSCSCGSVTLWEWHTISRIVLRCLMPLMMLLIMHQPQFISSGDWIDVSIQSFIQAVSYSSCLSRI